MKKSPAPIKIVFAAFMMAPQLGHAQDDELPTLKLDRVPSQPTFAGQTRAPMARPTRYAVETLADGLSAPWALAFLPSGEILVNENTGDMRIVDELGQVSEPLAGLPAMSHEGWAGLFDLALDPDFQTTGLVYFSYVAKADDGSDINVSRVARARLDRERHALVGLEIIVDGFGGQEMHFAPDGTLLVSGAGDVWNDDAQDLGITFGKLLRINPDGSIPTDNPLAAVPGARAEIYSLGHRDISGMATHPGTGEIWVTEHGPRGGDELNRIRPGANYGWKVISYGTEYNGDPVGEGRVSHEGMEQPRYFWRPSIAPSGLVFYTGGMFSDWRNSVLVTALAGQHISRLELGGDVITAEERLLLDREQRIRELRVGPDGALYALTNGDSEAAERTGGLLRIFRP